MYDNMFKYMIKNISCFNYGIEDFKLLKSMDAERLSGNDEDVLKVTPLISEIISYAMIYGLIDESVLKRLKPRIGEKAYHSIVNVTKVSYWYVYCLIADKCKHPSVLKYLNFIDASDTYDEMLEFTYYASCMEYNEKLMKSIAKFYKCNNDVNEDNNIIMYKFLASSFNYKDLPSLLGALSTVVQAQVLRRMFVFDCSKFFAYDNNTLMVEKNKRSMLLTDMIREVEQAKLEINAADDMEEVEEDDYEEDIDEENINDVLRGYYFTADDLLNIISDDYNVYSTCQYAYFDNVAKETKMLEKCKKL